MKEQRIDLFSKEVLSKADAICITTNGFVKKDGRAVMGRGVAKVAAEKWPTLPLVLGEAISKNGNQVQQIHYIKRKLGKIGMRIYSFPVKHNWWEKADLRLIERSTTELLFLIPSRYKTIYLPRPGCNNGKRDWITEVKPILEKYLDDRFVVVYL